MTSKEQFKLTHPYPGLYVVFEGLDGSGKTTTVQSIKETYERQGYRVVVVREPGGTAIGETLRRELKDATNQLSDYTRIAMFYAARAALLDEVVVPELEKGSIVIADRSYLSSYAMQCWAGEVTEDEFLSLNDTFIGDVVPDSLIYLDVHGDIRAARNAARAEGAGEEEKDTYDLRDQIYHDTVAEGYRMICQWHGDKTTTIQVNAHSRYNVYVKARGVWQATANISGGYSVNGHLVNRTAEIQPLIDHYVKRALLPLVKSKPLKRARLVVRLKNKIEDAVAMVRAA